MEKEERLEILDIQKQIKDHFTKSDWLELGYATNTAEIINGHERLLRSLAWGDDDYSGNILEVLSKMRQKNKGLTEVKAFIASKYSTPIVVDFISTAHKEVPKRMINFSPQVFTVPIKEQNKKLVAVMLPFTLSDTFESIKSVCTGLGLECKKADDIWENSTFMQDIFDLIFTCEIVVADFTGKNPNVFYEVGIAHTLGKTVVPITQYIEDIPADLRHHKALKYLPNSQGYENMKMELQKRLQTLVGDEFDY